jgi:hypothetical protein
VRASVREVATSSTSPTATIATDQPLTPYMGPTGVGAAATTYQSLAFPGRGCGRFQRTGWPSTSRWPSAGPAWTIGRNRWSPGAPRGAPIAWGRRLSSTTWPVLASRTVMSNWLARPAATLRKLSMVTWNCTIACLDPSAVGIRVELEITHSLVSGDTYGRAW